MARLSRLPRIARNTRRSSSGMRSVHKGRATFRARAHVALSPPTLISLPPKATKVPLVHPRSGRDRRKRRKRSEGKGHREPSLLVTGSRKGGNVDTPVAGVQRKVLTRGSSSSTLARPAKKGIWCGWSATTITKTGHRSSNSTPTQFNRVPEFISASMNAPRSIIVAPITAIISIGVASNRSPNCAMSSINSGLRGTSNDLGRASRPAVFSKPIPR